MSALERALAMDERLREICRFSINALGREAMKSP